MVQSEAVMPPSTRRMVLPAAAPVPLHRVEKIARLVADGFERRLRQFLAASVPRVRPKMRAARLGIPVGRAEPDEGRHQIDAAGWDRPPSPSAPGLGCRFDELQPVAQPLHGGAGNEDRAFQRIGALAVQLIGDGGEQPVAASARRWRRC